MPHGKWYLVYTNIDETETGTNMFHPAIKDVKVPLEATTEDKALAEAKTRHSRILKICTNPRVIYVVPLQ